MSREVSWFLIESSSLTIDSMSKFDGEKAAQSVKKFLRIAPHEEENGEGFLPSAFARWVTVDSATNYHPHDYEKYTGKKKVLVVCTEQKYFEMQNGNKFSTGNSPTELFLPLMHMEEAGLEFDICTPNGAPVAMEMWAMPERDLQIQDFFKANHTKFQKPMALAAIVYALKDDSPYIAVFIPGGHGAMLGLPENEDVARLIKWVKEKDRFLISIGHGPAAFLAAKERPHPYRGYRICACPDNTDKMAPKIGYLPGPIPWFMGERLEAHEMMIVNKRVTGMVKKDRKLLTGDSPKAANALGKLAVDCILAELKILEEPQDDKVKIVEETPPDYSIDDDSDDE
jgi:molecular chaperone Hsp31 and glyoxalase 3